MTPDDASRLLAQASRLREQGRVSEAILVYETLLSLHPALPESWYNLGLLRRQAGRWEAALEAYDQAILRRLRDPEEAHLNKAVILAEDLRRPEEAREALLTAIRLNPACLPALLNLGNLAEDQGRASEAASAYRRVLELAPHHPLALARLMDMTLASPGLGATPGMLRAALARPGLAAGDRSLLLFALARSLDRDGQYDRAFETAQQAREARFEAAGLAGASHNRRQAERRIDALIAAFATPEPVSPVRQMIEPVFIVGMFRSGSTLLEQILAAHGDVGAGGELPLVPRIVARIRPYPDAIASAPRALLDILAASYRSDIRRMHPFARMVTDKRPDNFLHVGLIKRLFPRAKILHTTRNPLDICASTHFLDLDPSISWALSPADTAHQFMQCERIMAHWKRLYPGDILTVSYERLIEDPRAGIGAVLACLGLPWADACLDFHAARAQVRTASVWQVRQPLRARSVERWRNYAARLEEARQLLEAAGDVAG